MPKQGHKLKQKIYYRSPKGRNYTKTWVVLPWQERYIDVQRTFGKTRIDLAKVYYWRFKLVKVKSKLEARKAVALTFREGGLLVDWHFVPDPKHATTWLYWILESLRIHHRKPIKEREIEESELKKRHKGKMISRMNQAKFAKLYKEFVKACEDLNNSGALPGFRSGAGKARYLKGLGSNYQYGKDFMKLKVGGSGTGLYATSRKQKAIPLEEEGRFFQPPDEPVVVKVAKPSDIYGARQEAKDLVEEVKILAAIGPHPNIIGLVDAIPAKDGIYVFLEAGIEDLEDRAKRKKLGKKEIIAVCYGIIEGLAHMHKRAIYHLDIKPPNVLLFPGDVPKIIDFGLSICRGIHDRKDAETNWSWNVGTVGYIPPECYRGKPPSKRGLLSIYMAKRDTYATGMTILDSLIGPQLGLEFKGNIGFAKLKGAEMKLSFWENELPKKLKTVKDPDFRDLGFMTLNMIARDVNNRPTINECLESFRTAFSTTVQKYKAAVRLARRNKQIARARKALVTYGWIKDRAGNDLDILMTLVKFNEDKDLA
jgi:serine/threonine protein kinase